MSYWKWLLLNSQAIFRHINTSRTLDTIAVDPADPARPVDVVRGVEREVKVDHVVYLMGVKFHKTGAKNYQTQEIRKKLPGRDRFKNCLLYISKRNDEVLHWKWFIWNLCESSYFLFLSPLIIMPYNKFIQLKLSNKYQNLLYLTNGSLKLTRVVSSPLEARSVDAKILTW